MIRTTTATLMGLLAAVTAGCGSWSNRDLEFASALPDRQELRSKLPMNTSSTQPLTGPATHQDGLLAGEPSKAYADAKSAAANFNGILDFLLTVLDQVRLWPPTSRTTTVSHDDTRVWGPFPDHNNPGYEVQITVQQRSPERYAWRIQARQPPGDLFDILTGELEATTTVKQGRGTMTVHVANFRDRLKVDESMKKLEQIAITYDTRGAPLAVTMEFTDQRGPLLSYAYQENEDRSGRMDFTLSSTDPRMLRLGIVARWTPEGAGKTVSTVEEGTYSGASVTECWDSAFAVSYFVEAWPGGQTSGVADACPELTGP